MTEGCRDKGRGLGGKRSRERAERFQVSLLPGCGVRVEGVGLRRDEENTRASELGFDCLVLITAGRGKVF